MMERKKVSGKERQGTGRDRERERWREKNLEHIKDGTL